MSTNGWLIDLGATDHIIYDSSLYQTYCPWSHSSVTLPNGQKATITHKGTIRVDYLITLYNALCVPLFHVNLASVSKITHDSGLFLKFTFNTCVFQDPTSGKVIGSAKQHKGLYYFQDHQTSFIRSIGHRVEQNSLLWHKRLGYMSFLKLPLIKDSVSESLTSNSLFCDICSLAKRLSVMIVLRLILSLKSQLRHLGLL